MRLTPLDIRKQEFTRALRGFDAEEVLAFLQMLSGQWEDLLDEARRRDDKIRELESKMSHYEKVEEALQDALQTARETSKNALQNAEEKARLIVESAEKRAEDIKRDAERDRHQIKREASKLSGRRTEIVTRLRAFLMSELEILARYEGDDPFGFIKLLPAEEQSGRRSQSESSRSSGRSGVTPQGAKRPQAKTDAGTEHAATQAYASASDEHDEDIDEDIAPVEERPTMESDLNEPDQDSSDEFVDEPAVDEAEEQRGDGSHGEDVVRGTGWTTRTVVSQPSEQRTSQQRLDRDEEAGADVGEADVGEADLDDARRQGSSDEIQKIRRILKDLD